MVEVVLLTSAAQQIEEIVKLHAPVVVPAHAEAEALAVIRRLLRMRHVAQDDAIAAVDRLATFPAERHALAPLLSAAFALRERIGAHDALYAALAERLACSLVTCDGALARAIGDRVSVFHVEASPPPAAETSGA